MRRKSGGSDSSKNDTSGQSSPVTVENVEKSKASRYTKRKVDALVKSISNLFFFL